METKKVKAINRQSLIIAVEKLRKEGWVVTKDTYSKSIKDQTYFFVEMEREITNNESVTNI